MNLLQGINGFICGSEGLDSSGLSSSAAVSFCFFFYTFLESDIFDFKSYCLSNF